MLKVAVLVLGAIFAIVGIILFSKKGTTGKNKIKILGAEFQLSGSSLVIFVLGCILIILAAKMDNNGTEPKKDSDQVKTTTGEHKNDSDQTETTSAPPDFVAEYGDFQ